jgi:hypothetical protein
VFRNRQTISKGHAIQAPLPTLLALLSLQLSAFIPLPSAFAQAPGYSREEIIAREREQVAGITENATTRSRNNNAGSDILSEGSRAIGSAHTRSRGGGGSGGGQRSAMITYDQHREITPPADATLRIGPLYSDIGIAQSIGYRYIKLKGSGVDFLTGNSRGEYLRDGSDYPLVSSLTLNNYLIITRHMDLSLNISASYSHYPMETQEDETQIDLTDEGVFATFSSELQLSRDSRLLVYDDILYRTDYVDTQGLTDRYGGEEYEYVENAVGGVWDWMPSPFDNVAISASRTDTIPLTTAFTNQESVVYSEAASYQRAITRFWSAGLLGSFRQSLYEVESRSDIHMYSLSAFTAARLTRKLLGSASLGYQLSSYESGESAGRSSGSVSGGIGLEHEISESKSQKITYQRRQTEGFSGGVDVSDTISYNYSWSGERFPGAFSTRYATLDPQEATRSGYSDWTTRLQLGHQLTRLLRLTFLTSYAQRKTDASASAAAAATAAGTQDATSDYDTWTVRLGGSMPLTKKTAFSTYVEHVDRMSDNENLAYTRDVIAATITWSHDF